MYWITPDGSYYEGQHVAEGSIAVTQRPSQYHQWSGEWVFVGPSKEEQIAAILAALPSKPNRLQVQLTVQLGELTASVLAPTYGMTVPQAIAYVYSKNPAYRRAKDAEVACIAIDAAP